MMISIEEEVVAKSDASLNIIREDSPNKNNEATNVERKKKIDNRPKKRKPGFHEQMFEESSYYFRNGLRYVYPYNFKFVAHAKGRWIGKKVIDVFRNEFHMETSEYYEKAIMSGKIRVNDTPVDLERVLTQRDILQTCVHRHEPPVLHRPIQFLENSEQLVVINKPSSIPVHPCGRYRHNTIVFLLGKEHNLERLHTIHRIDRLTSGILMFAKTAEKAREMDAAMKQRLPEKRYLARVVGEFPSVRQRVEEPIVVVSHKIGVCHVDAERGKPCLTEFERLSYNGTTSVVRCIPHTGRMHQIRVHLQWLGYPIVNDPIYNHPTAWTTWNNDSKTADIQKVINELLRTRKDRTCGDDDDDVVTQQNGTDDGASGSTHSNTTPSAAMDDSHTTDESVPTKRVKLDGSCADSNNLVGEENISASDIETEGLDHTEAKLLSTGSLAMNPNSSCSSVMKTADIDDARTCDSILSLPNSTVAQACFTDVTVASTQSSVEVTNNNETELACDGNFKKSLESTSHSATSSATDSATDLATHSVTHLATDLASPVASTVSPPRYHYTSRDIGEEYHDDDCTYCQRLWVEPLESELVMYLHALSYEGPGWRYETEVPTWASEHFQE